VGSIPTYSRHFYASERATPRVLGPTHRVYARRWHARGVDREASV